MLATQTPEIGPDTKDVKQWIKEKIAQTIKALQKRYVATDTAVTSEDAEVNLLCCALEAVFIHGIKSKYVRSEVRGRGRKGGGRDSVLPQPDFWGLLKSVTHRDVILELERLSFISSGVGRCRAWVRLALNDGLLECYLASLLREDSKLSGYYQQGALLLDPEDREVLLSLLQGLASLSFQLSYKSAVLNEWTVTPLALAGLCPPLPTDLTAAGRRPPHLASNGKRKESWDTASQSSSGGSDAGVGGRGGGGVAMEEGAETRSSNQSLDTAGSSQLSSSLSSDSLLQGTERDTWDISHAVKRAYREASTTSSQDSMREDSYISSLAGDQLSESTAFSSLDNDTHTPATETHTPATETHTPATETHTPATETHTPATETHMPATDTRTPATDTHTPASDTHTPASDTRTPVFDTHLPSTLRTQTQGPDSHFTYTHKTNRVSPTTSDVHTQIHITPVSHTSAEDTHSTPPVIRDTHQSPITGRDAPFTDDACSNDTHLGSTSAVDAQLAHMQTIDTVIAHTQASDTHLQAEQSTLTDTAVEVLRQNKRTRSPMRRNRSPEGTSTSPTPEESSITTATTSDTTATASDPEMNTDEPSQLIHASPCPAEPAVLPRRSGSNTSRRRSSDFHNPTSWISEEDFYKPDTDEASSLTDRPSFGVALLNGSQSPPPEPEVPQPAPRVVQRRQIGLSNPFRGLLKLGTLERRGAVGMWWEHHCELSPFELRLYLDPEDRAACHNSSLLRCEEARLHGDDGRFVLAFAAGKRLHLRAGSRGEAEDWVERVQEAVAKIRPATKRCPDDEWEVIRAPKATGSETSTSSPSTPTSAPTSPDHAPAAPPLPPQLLPLDWTRPTDPEPDAIKEAVVYQLASSSTQGPSLSPCPPSEDPSLGWAPLVLSLSLEALQGFRWQTSAVDDGEDGGGHKAPLFRHAIQTVRDVVPDAARGGPEYFRVVTSNGVTLTLRAENGKEARAWRDLIRGALDSYLDTEEEELAEGAGPVAGGGGGTMAGWASLVQGSIQRLVQHRLKGEAAALLPHLCTVPTERGLDAQSFKCTGCSKQIGFSAGRARLCEFSAQYYCESCHRGDAIVIPSRLVHNWDLTPREVSKQVLKLLAQIENEPLLNLDLLNPDLYNHTETMAIVRMLRQKLRLLGDYMLLCRSGINKKLQARLNQRSYLLESDQLYSVTDLWQIADGQYEAFLLSLIQFSASHVHSCDLCTQRGFICQICNADDIIFPFQFETTSRCKGCKSVFHSTCREDSPTCPRCVRLQRYLERDLQD